MNCNRKLWRTRRCMHCGELYTSKTRWGKVCPFCWVGSGHRRKA